MFIPTLLLSVVTRSLKKYTHHLHRYVDRYLHHHLDRYLHRYVNHYVDRYLDHYQYLRVKYSESNIQYCKALLGACEVYNGAKSLRSKVAKRGSYPLAPLFHLNFSPKSHFCIFLILATLFRSPEILKSGYAQYLKKF